MTNNHLNPDWMVRSQILAMLPIRRTHQQLDAIEMADASFPRPTVLGRKRFYDRAAVLAWIAATFGNIKVANEPAKRKVRSETHIQPQQPTEAEKPKARKYVRA
jgi:hypothetical protein